MKRIVPIVLCLLVFVCMLTSCIIIPLSKHFEIDSENVASVEIYRLNDDETLYGGFSEIKDPVYKIPDEAVGDFLDDLAEIKFTDSLVITIAAMDPSFYYNTWTVHVNYKDGSYELISCDGYGETYDENGEVTDSHHYGCEDDEWRALIVKYVPKDIMRGNNESQ